MSVALWTAHLLRVYESVSGWIAISPFMKDRLLDAGVPEERAFSLLHSWDLMEPPGEDRDEGYYLYLGRISTEKGVETLMSAWSILKERLGAECPRLVMGGDGPLRGWLEQEISKIPEIEYRGWVVGDEKTALLANCRAVLVPSIWWEPLGVVTYEAYDGANLSWLPNPGASGIR